MGCVPPILASWASPFPKELGFAALSLSCHLLLLIAMLFDPRARRCQICWGDAPITSQLCVLPSLALKGRTRGGCLAPCPVPRAALARAPHRVLLPRVSQRGVLAPSPIWVLQGHGLALHSQSLR